MKFLFFSETGDGGIPPDWYLENGTMKMQYFEGSGEIGGYKNMGANPTVYSGSGSDSASAELNKSGSAIFNGQSYNNGESFNVGPFTIITGTSGFNLEKFLSYLGNTGGDFYTNLGGLGLGDGQNPYFRGDIDKIKNAEGYFGGITNGLSRGDKGPPSLLNFMVDVVALGDLAYSALRGNEDSIYISERLRYPVSHDTIKKYLQKMK